MNRAEEVISPAVWACGRVWHLVGVYYYRELAEACEAFGIGLDFVLIHADINTARKYVDSKDRERLAEYLADLIGFAKGASADTLEEDGSSQIVQRQIAHFVDYENLRCEINAHPPIQTTFPVSTTKVVHQIMQS